jgi:hypothetical protein
MFIAIGLLLADASDTSALRIGTHNSSDPAKQQCNWCANRGGRDRSLRKRLCHNGFRLKTSISCIGETPAAATGGGTIQPLRVAESIPGRQLAVDGCQLTDAAGN